ncbi:MAG: YggS family pyridoxal phosphate-dependent enzyme [Ignavibacteriae bacterium]|nr:YggS family pyridoxal phosphate-dependent enzyme [Ignavibacteriota bacterium]
MVAENVKNIRRQISEVCSRIGRDSKEIILIAVSKTFGSEFIREAISAGISDIGENYVQELQRKQQELEREPIRWHFIGHLQRNKVKYIIPWIQCIHSVDSLRLGEELSHQAAKHNRTLDILVEVNTSDEESKFGVKPEQTIMMVKELLPLNNLNVVGLMTIGKFPENPEDSRPTFQLMRHLQQQAVRDGILLPHLSMGMTNDYHVAIEEGATMVRIGTAIFGKRNYQH